MIFLVVGFGVLVAAIWLIFICGLIAAVADKDIELAGFTLLSFVFACITSGLFSLLLQMFKDIKF